MAKYLSASGMKKCIGCFTCMMMCSAVNKKDHSISKSAIKVTTVSGLAAGIFQATVCLACTDERACALACPVGALDDRPGGGVLLNKEKCIGCRSCVSACIADAVFFDEESQTPIICRHCGACARFCPHECLVMEEGRDNA